MLKEKFKLLKELKRMKKILNKYIINKYILWGLGSGDWGLGIGDYIFLYQIN